MTTRYAKILLSLALAAFAVMVTFNNISDYGSNFAFVSHVLSMDTTFAGNTAMYRAITTPSLWHAAYWLIILGEGLTGALLAYGALSLWRARKADASSWNGQEAAFRFYMALLGVLIFVNQADNEPAQPE